MNKKLIRTLAYVGIIGAIGITAMTCFVVSQYEKAKFKASETVRLSSENKMKTTSGAEQVWWTEINEDFTAISKKNSNAYIGTAIPAYTFSIGTLVAFGLILKHAEATKEKEDNEVA